LASASVGSIHVSGRSEFCSAGRRNDPTPVPAAGDIGGPTWPNEDSLRGSCVEGRALVDGVRLRFGNAVSKWSMLF
jgi:hypothetical protein